MVGAGGVSTSAWGTDAPSVIAAAWGRAYLAQIVWGIIGLSIAVVSRSAMVAVAVGVGYVLVVESLVEMVSDAPSDWLLGTTLNALASGGTASVSFVTSLTIGVGYAIVGLALAGAVLTRRDVTD